MINIGQLVGVTPTLLFMDKLGRRRLAIWGAIGMGIPHSIMAGVIGTYGHSWPEHQGVGWFCVALICKHLRSLTIQSRPWMDLTPLK